MKFVYNYIDAVLTLEEDIPYVIVIENPKMMRQFIQSLRIQLVTDQGPFVLSENENTLRMNKVADLIYNPFSLEMNQKKILTKIHQRVAELAISADYFQKTTELRNSIYMYLEELLGETDYPLQYNENFDIMKLVTALGVVLEENQDFLTNLCQYVELCSRILGIKVFIFYNLTGILDHEELEAFYLDMAYKKIYILQLENMVHEFMQSKKLVVVDNDLCLIQWHD